MPALGQYGHSLLGLDNVLMAHIFGGITTFAMPSPNNCWAARFQAPDTRDVYSVWVNWNTVSAAGTVTLRIETIDTTSGKPTGTLYDANATLDFTPVAGWQQLTFASHPTTGLVAGNEYAILLIVKLAGTTQTLRSHSNVSGLPGGPYPAIALTATDGSTRTSLAEVNGAIPIASLVFSDGSEEVLGLCPFYTNGGTQTTVFGTKAVGTKFTLNNAVKVAGVCSSFLNRNGTPNDLRVRILNTDSGSSLVTGCSLTLAKNSLLNVGSRGFRALFPAVVTLAAGTYRLALDDPSHASTSGNNYGVWAGDVRSTATMPGGAANTNFQLTVTSDITVGSPVWTETATEQPGLGLVLDGQATITGGGGSGGFIIGG